MPRVSGEGDVLRTVLATTTAVATAPDLDGALHALLGGVRALTGAEAASVRLSERAEDAAGPCRVFRWWGGDRYSWHDDENLPGSVAARVRHLGRGIVVDDNAALAAAGDDGAARALAGWTARSSLVVPLRAGAAAIGTLNANSSALAAFDESQLPALQILADHAGAVVAHAWRLEETRRARDELEAVIDAAEDAIIVSDPQGRLVRMNRSARDRFQLHWQSVPGSIADYRALLERWLPPHEAGQRLAIEEALDGRASTQTLTLPGLHGPREVHVHATPIHGSGGEMLGAVVVSRDITDLRRAIVERAQLDGAVKTARAVAHEINNALALVVGYAELLPKHQDPSTSALVDTVVTAARDAVRAVVRLQRIVRFEETDQGAGPMLDLRAAFGTEPTRP
jgi:PAS domain-containing protein